MNKSLLLICLSLLLSWGAAAQPDHCFHFEDFPAGSQFGPATGLSPGDIAFTGGDAKVSIGEILYPDGNTGFLNAMIYGPPDVGWLDGQFIIMGNNSLLFDFSAYPNGVTEVCFDFFDGGGTENFAVNGAPVSVLELFSEIAQLSVPGISIQLTGLDSSNFLQQGTVCLTGNIQSLLIGGQEFGLDNVCFFAAPPPPCPIENLQAEIVSCDDAGNFNIELDFDWTSPLTVIEHFDIFVDGQPVAFISQTELPYLLEGIQPLTDALMFTLTVCRNDDPNCCASVILQKQCPESGCVEFEGLEQDLYGGSAGTPPGVEIYNESNVGLRLIPFQSLFWSTTYGDLIVLDAASNPAMAAASGQHLKFESINAVFDLTGYPDPVDSVNVDFYYNGGAINIAANGASILIQNNLAAGLYALSPGVTLEVAFKPGSATEGQLIFRGNIESLLIGGSGDFRIDNFCVNPQPEPCELSNLHIRPLPCNAVSPTTFFVEVDFDYQGVSDSFAVFSDGGEEGHYAYSSLPVTLGPIPLNNLGVYAFFVKDLGIGGCSLSDTLQLAPCTGCAFQGLAINYLGQTDSGQTLIELDLSLAGPTPTNFFSVYFNGALYQQYGWSEAPVQIAVPCIPNNTDPVPQITVCEGEDHCCVTLPLLYAQACPPECEISNMSVQASPCNPNGVFNVKLDFDYQNVSDTFELWINGNATGQSYAYSELPLILSPFVAPTPALEFKVVDSGNPGCMASVVLPTYNCSPCPTIDSVAYHLSACNDNGGFFLVIDHIISTAPALSNIFFVNINGQSFGAYSYSDLPIELGPLAGNGSTVYNVTIFTQNTTNCAYTFNVGPVDCSGGCPLEGAEVVGTANCIDAAGAQYAVAFDVTGAQEGDFLVVTSLISGATASSSYEGFLFVQLPNTGLGYDKVRICTLDDPSNTGATDCCVLVDYDINCPPGCPWSSITITPNDCNDDGTWTAVLDMALIGPALNSGFVVESANYLEDFSFLDLPVTIGPFPGNGEPWTFTVYIPGTTCQQSVTILAPDCSNTGDCLFSGVIAEPHPCNADGQFLVDIEVQVNNPGALGYLVFADGQINGPYSYALPFVTLGPFAADGSTVYDFLILDLENPTCFGYAEVGPIDCSGSCEIYDLAVETLDCNPDGTYNLIVDFNVANPGNDFFDVYGGPNNAFLGYFPIAELPVTIENFPASGNDFDRIKICINDNPDCCRVKEFPAPDCNTGDCIIHDLGVSLAYCDSAGFYVQLHFGYANTGGAGYRVQGNGQVYGTYSYDEPFPVIGPFPPELDVVWELVVKDVNHPDCSDFTTFTSMYCDDSTETCIQFDIFDGLQDTLFLAGLGQVNDSIYSEDNVTIWSRPIPWVNTPDYFGGAIIYPYPTCGFSPDGAYLYVSGALEFDFSAYAVPPNAVSFDLGYCSTSAVPTILLTVNGDTYQGSIFSLPDFLGGVAVQWAPGPAGVQGSLSLLGNVSSFTVGSISVSIDNICFDGAQLAVDDNCLEFAIFDNSGIDTLANYGQPAEMDYTEDGVHVTAQAIEWNGQNNYFTGVYATDGFPCGFSDDDAALQFGGALRFDFSGLGSLPNRVSFDLAFCAGQAQHLRLKVNGETYAGNIQDLPDALPNGIGLALFTTDDGEDWHIVVEGTVEVLTLGGNLTIDNVCYELPSENQEVWPGDANHDNIAHHIDLLNVGLAFGAQGPARATDSDSWMSFSADNWAGSFANGLNYKHADCNGDGSVDELDRNTITQNYGLTHGPVGPFDSLPGTDTDPPIYVDFPAQLPDGASFTVPIIAGSADEPVEDVYGIAFTVEFDPGVIDPSAIQVVYPVSWFGEPGVNTLSIDRTYAAEGQIEIAITRTDQNNVSGYGQVAYIIGIIDDIAGLAKSEVSVGRIRAIRKDETPVPLSRPSTSFTIAMKEEPPAEDDARGIFSLFPNPTGDWVTVSSRHGFEPEELRLMTMSGQVIDAPQEGNRRISLEGLPNGTYILRIRTGKTLVHKLAVKY